MSSGTGPITRKRTHSLEQGGERAGSDINAKKPRVASQPSSSRRKRKKRTVPVVEDIDGSTKSHDDGADPMSAQVQRRDCRRGKPRRVESDEDDISTVLGSMPRSQMASRVCHFIA